MADVKITDLTAIGLNPVNPATFPLPMVDLLDNSMAASGTTKKVTVNQILGAGGTATLASATITGDLTVNTNVLKVDSTNDRVGIGTASPAKGLEINKSANAFTTIGTGEVLRLIGDDGNVNSRITEIGFGSGPTGATYPVVVLGAVNTSVSGFGTKDLYFATRAGISDVAPLERYRIASDGVATWSNVGGVAGTAMTLNSTGLGVGGSPLASHLIHSQGPVGIGGTGSGTRTSYISNANACSIYYTDGGASYPFDNFGNLIIQPRTSAGRSVIIATSSAAGTPVERLIVDPSGNVGVGVTPSAWNSNYNAFDIGQNGTIAGRVGSSNTVDIASNGFRNTSGNWVYKLSGSNTACRYQQDGSTGIHYWFTGAAGTAGNTITGFSTPIMTLDASGNLLVGTTSGTSHNLRKQGTTVEGDTHLNVGNAEHLFFACSSVTYNAAAAAYKITRNSSTLRSINAGGTINASGADYAEYMVKCGDFVIAKGDVAGIDANGKLTNVFADAVSFVVKSTDPSYVGNDKWGVDLEGDALEAARQLVDRIAFAGQVPVNVTGAKAGDYIVPVANGTGIKGQAVSNPTFEQYQLAVGKVISIDADGRARIIVKVA